MISNLASGLVRFFDPDKRIVGLGFFIDQKRVVTCAHVVLQALNISEKQIPSFIGKKISVDLPLSSPGKFLEARFVFCAYQDSENNLTTDIAGIEIASSPSISFSVLSLGNPSDLWDHDFRAYGFPNQKDEGIWTSGVIRAMLANGTLQIEANLFESYHVARGFSGGPVWDNRLNQVVGMIVATEKDITKTTAYAIPSKKLEQSLCTIWPGLKSQNVFDESVDELLEEKIAKLEEELALHKRILRKLKEQTSLYGIATPVHILMQIEDEEIEISRITRNIDEIRK